MKYKVDVTYKDLAEGVPGEADACPVALALKRTFPTATKIFVSSSIEIVGESQIQISTPLDVYNKIKTFDAGDPIAPFSFELNFLPDKKPGWFSDPTVPVVKFTDSIEQRRKNLETLRSLIQTSFVWKKTPEGFGYWWDVDNKIRSLIEELTKITWSTSD